jgi:hypothetical protein
MELINQHDKVVQVGIMKTMVRTRAFFAEVQ